MHLPAGLVGNPRATAPCTRAQFDADSCPASAQVGTTTVHVTSLGLPQDASGQIYVLEPNANEPARLGIVVQPVRVRDSKRVTTTLRVKLKRSR